MGKKKVVQSSEKVVTKEISGAEAPLSKAPSTKKSKRIDHGRIYIKASYNNTLVSVTDANGNLITWMSAGSMGFSGPKKATPFASSKVIGALAEQLKATGPSDIDVIVRGVGGGRDSALRSLVNHGFNITSIRDVTPIPHNGPKAKKPRRV
ncbi:MAG: small subunit ribosomal protein S11 [Parcubacteria group bacterium Gr01-1014_20]|nr:MAG: small subunit ribosomal protein S11 [Parcubacteria group bacterium Gr01-1014_20]